MVRDHTEVNKQALALAPEDNDTSRALTKQATTKREELAKLNGAAFDKAGRSRVALLRQAAVEAMLRSL
jgi:putative membrane protein